LKTGILRETQILVLVLIAGCVYPFSDEIAIGILIVRVLLVSPPIITILNIFV
jgi:hypothetical protein